MIKANARTVDVKDGSFFQKGIWNLAPEIKPDIYHKIEFEEGQKVTFYIDIDSISFEVIPGHSYDFIILLNNKDTCHTRISAPSRSPSGSKIMVTDIDPDLLQQDFTFLREALQREHGGLYRYISEDDFNHLSDSLFRTVDRPMSPFQFGKLVRFFLGAIRDGHTGCNLPSELMQYYAKHVKMFPVQLYFADESSFVQCSDFKELPPETELLSIESIPINDIRKILFRFLASDGRIETKKYWILNEVEFPFLYSWVFGEKNGYDVTFKTQTGPIESIHLKAGFIKESCLPNRQDKEKYLQLDYKSGNLAILTIGTFSSDRLRQTNEEFEKFLQMSFKEIKSKKVKKLIIDLRNNGGGDDQYGALLYSYLTKRSFRYFASIESNTRKFTMSEHPRLGMQKPNEDNFKGEIIFLINGLSFSTTSDLCAIAKSNRRAKFVGEETGGAYYGNTSGGYSGPC